MRPIISFALGLIFAVATAGESLAACDPTTEPDLSEVAAGRAAVEANCDCETAENHGAYVSCAAAQAKAVIVNNKSCRGVVKKCAARSTCGKPGFVTCNIPRYGTCDLVTSTCSEGT